jgi:hypothetical protein
VTITQSDELVFTVSGATATPVQQIAIEDLGLTERTHLQEWVIGHPEIIGSSVLIITFEFDQWKAASGVSPKDRLDVLAIDRDGRLVIAELKRGVAPDTVELQAIKYAAMASRFTTDQLAELHVEFLERTYKQTLNSTESLEKLQAHTASGLSPELLLQPRIVLLARDFSPTVTSSVIWLNEQGLDITLKRYQAYQTPANETVVTVSQYYPVRDVAGFEVAPHLRSHAARTGAELPEIVWSADNLQLLLSLPFDVPHAILDLCSAHPGEWIGSSDAYERAGVEKKSGMGRLAGFGWSMRTRFGRSNAPWTSKWEASGVNQMYYSVDSGTAELWKTLRADSDSSNGPDY